MTTASAELLAPETPDKMLYDMFVIAELLKRGAHVEYGNRLETYAKYIRDTAALSRPALAAPPVASNSAAVAAEREAKS